MRRNDNWVLVIAKRRSLRELLEVLPLRHQEKIDRSKIALDLLGGYEWNEGKRRLGELRKKIESEVIELKRIAAFRLE